MRQLRYKSISLAANEMLLEASIDVGRSDRVIRSTDANNSARLQQRCTAQLLNVPGDAPGGASPPRTPETADDLTGR